MESEGIIEIMKLKTLLWQCCSCLTYKSCDCCLNTFKSRQVDWIFWDLEGCRCLPADLPSYLTIHAIRRNETHAGQEGEKLQEPHGCRKLEDCSSQERMDPVDRQFGATVGRYRDKFINLPFVLNPHSVALVFRGFLDSCAGIIMGTHKEGGATTFWSYTVNLPLSSNSMISWKFCYLLHKVLRGGHRNVRCL